MTEEEESKTYWRNLFVSQINKFKELSQDPKTTYVELWTTLHPINLKLQYELAKKLNEKQQETPKSTEEFLRNAKLQDEAEDRVLSRIRAKNNKTT